MTIDVKDYQTYKRLVTSNNDQIWYEDINVAAGTMTELIAARGDIDTTDQLIIFEGFQKAFIVNGAIFRVVDFLNTKLLTTNIGTNYPTNGMVLTQASTTAKMIVDFLSASTGSAYVYGYTITTAPFEDGYTVSNAAASVSFSAVSVNDSRPHWYNWTPYGALTSVFGEMPNKAYLGCLYRGRPVLAGNPELPNQWYMAKVANPWMWLYNPNDPLSAIIGQNADAGQVGDIIRAVVPYGDDFLVFGGANSIHILNGDPASGGSIDRVCDVTGIYSQYSWCKDAFDNLYFWGQNGLYIMEVGRGKPQNISQTALPNWVTDWALEPKLHRVLLGYDPQENGILIIKTTLANGSSVGYFYDLTLHAFWPETYPIGIYSMQNYNSNEPAFRKLILGCSDGYMRCFDKSTKGDELTSGAITAINSYVALPIEQVNPNPNVDGKLLSLVVETAGGITGSSFADTDATTMSLYRGGEAETVLESIVANSIACLTVTLSGPIKATLNTKIRGPFIGIKFSNNTSGQSWAINRIYGNFKEERGS